MDSVNHRKRDLDFGQVNEPHPFNVFDVGQAVRQYFELSLNAKMVICSS